MMSLRSGLIACAYNVLFLATLAAQKRTLVERVPGYAAKLRNPFEGQARAQQAGAKLFTRECAACHGKNAEGIGKTPPLRQPEVRNALPGTLFWILRNGAPVQGMPSFAHLPEAARWQIVTFLKSRLQ